MKKIIMTIGLLTILAGCGDKQFKGFLVGKEYILIITMDSDD